MLVLILGTVADMYRPASMAAVADIVPEHDRQRAYALQFWAINLGFSVASTSAGLLLHFGFGVLFVLDAISTYAGLGASVYGYVIAVNGVLIVVGQPLTLGVLSRWPRRVTLPLGMALVGAGVAGLTRPAMDRMPRPDCWPRPASGGCSARWTAAAPMPSRGESGVTDQPPDLGSASCSGYGRTACLMPT
ncbi:MAG: hypothetical protein QOK11_266 [Pseudonocardiales bacterium]|nr:hypothetical protein [Pseudonocardiales bacterium]